MHDARLKFRILSLLIFFTSSSIRAQTLPKIQWDPSTLRLIEQGGGYGRMVRLRDGSIACAFDHQRKMWLRRSTDGGTTFGTPVLVAAEPDCLLTNAGLLSLKDGALLYFWNERPLAAISAHRHSDAAKSTRPFLIRISRSTNLGQSWSPAQTLYTAGTTFQTGCWEPAAVQLPNGEIQLFFANEAPFPKSDEQEITLLRSTDGGKTWSQGQRIVFRSNHRDGMPAPLILLHNRGIVVAIEDNGLSGDRFKPAIIHMALSADWRMPVIDGVSPFRQSALALPLDPQTYAGAPYLVQLPSGPTLLSYQESFDGTLDHCRMAVCVGTEDAADFANKNYPLETDHNIPQAWNSLFVRDSNTVTALLTTSVKGVLGLWAIDGYLVPSHQSSISVKP